MSKAVSTKTARSAKSAKSTKSTKSTMSLWGDADNIESEVSQIQTFESYLPSVCRKFNLPQTVIVKKTSQSDPYYRNVKYETPVKYKKINAIAPKATSELFFKNLGNMDNSETAVECMSYDNNDIVVTSIYDHMNRLFELKMHNINPLPRELMQVLVLITKYYTKLAKISIIQCPINGFTIYELNKLLPLTTITEVFLDGSKVSEGNYDVLLDHQESRIMHLSLSRCQINDEVCKRILSKIRYTAPAEISLKALNLSSNYITDDGAKYIGETLRMNRNLRYLNLADNRITDDGAGHLLDSLTEFPLTVEETLDKRRRYIEYWKKGLYLKNLIEFPKQSVDGLTSKKGPNSKSERFGNSLHHRHSKGNKNKVEKLVEDFVDPLQDPFQPNFVKVKDKICYCNGNMVLSGLNLSYNRLSYLSVVKLLEVMKYQSIMKQPGEQGLLRVSFEGNFLPETCHEYVIIQELLGKNTSKLKKRTKLT